MARTKRLSPLSNKAEAVYMAEIVNAGGRRTLTLYEIPQQYIKVAVDAGMLQEKEGVYPAKPDADLSSNWENAKRTAKTQNRVQQTTKIPAGLKDGTLIKGDRLQNLMNPQR
jgi:hypothetical protein